MIPDFEKYEASTKGNVRNKNTKYLLKPYIKNGYKMVGLYNPEIKKIQQRSIHRLVALTFIPNTNNYPIVDHIDRIRSNNSVNNLKWCTVKQNNMNKTSKTDPKIIQKSLDNNVIKIWNSIKEIEISLGYNKSAIANCCRGILKTYKKYRWEWNNNNNRTVITKTNNADNYKCIGIIDNYDFSDYKIRETPEIEVINKSNVIMKTFSNGDYKRYSLVDKNTKKNIKILVHRLIYAVSNNNRLPNDKKYIDHKDKNKINNNLENLELVTNRENSIRALGKKVKQIDKLSGIVIRIYNCLVDAFNSVKKNSNLLNGSNNISKVCNKQRKTAYGYKWEWEK